jgi:hypothetical protein
MDGRLGETIFVFRWWRGSLWVGVLFVVVWEEVIFLDEGVEGGSFMDIVDIVVVCLGSEGVLLVVCVGYGLR